MLRYDWPCGTKTGLGSTSAPAAEGGGGFSSSGPVAQPDPIARRPPRHAVHRVRRIVPTPPIRAQPLPVRRVTPNGPTLSRTLEGQEVCQQGRRLSRRVRPQLALAQLEAADGRG